jgi:dihydroflavonol-4-reductase
MESKSLVLVTGISGYLGAVVAKTALDAGYRVRGTVRNAEDSKKADEVKKHFEFYSDNLELVSMDLLDYDSVIRATDGVDYVLHVANPVGMQGSEEFFVKPCLEGTRAILEGSLKHGVKRIIVTSSIVSIHDEKRPT